MVQVKSITSGAVGTLTRPEGVTKAFITVEGGVRFWYDGTTPSATTGHVASTGAQIKLAGSEITNFKAWATETTVLQVTYTVG